MDLHDLGWNAEREQQWQAHCSGSLFPARICRQGRKEFILLCRHGRQKAVSLGRLHHDQGQGASPVVGDWVAAEGENAGRTAVIEQVLPRRSIICRKSAGSAPGRQIMAANVDIIFIISGLDRPVNINRIERSLTQVWSTGAAPVIILNKKDLCARTEKAVAKVQTAAGSAPVHAVSALGPEGLAPLHRYLSRGRTISLLGPSGTGKSTILNSLMGTDVMKVRETHAATGEGRHTTTHREMFILPAGGVIIDMPGIREIGLWTEKESLQGAFGDIDRLSSECRFRDCTHRSEPGCAVREAADSQTLAPERYNSYLKLQEELVNLDQIKNRQHWKRKK